MKRAGKLIIVIGVLLILLSFGYTLWLHIASERAELDVSEALAKLKELLPPESIGSPEEYSSQDMPALQLDGRDIIALIAIPSLDTELPLAAGWEEKDLISLPQRFSGSVYDNSLVIGGYDRKGQLECLKRLDIGDGISVTDMTGAVFSYTVSDIERKGSAENAIPSDSDYDLTLFVRDSETMEYIVVRCTG